MNSNGGSRLLAYALRPDGLADVEVAPGRVIPMPVSLAEQAGHERKSSLFDPSRSALALNDSMQHDSAARDAGGQQGLPRDAVIVPEAIPNRRDPAKDPTAAEKTIQDAMRKQGIDPNPDARAHGVVEGKEMAPEQKRPGEAVRGGNRVVEGPGPGERSASNSVAQQGAPRSRIVQLSKGGDVRASFTRIPGIETSDEARNLILGDPYSEQTQKTAEEAGLSPEQVFLAQSAGTIVPETYEANAAKVASLMQQQVTAKQDEITQRQEAIKREEERRVKVDNAIRAKQELIQRRDNETRKLTPQSAREVWASKSTLSQIGAAIQMALGGYLQGLQGRQDNPGYRMVMDGITQEVADQQRKYDDAKDRGLEARSDYAEAVALYGTPEAAALDIENRRLEATAKLAEKAALEIGTAEYKNASLLFGQQLRQQMGVNLQKQDTLERGYIAQENFQYAPPQYAQIGGRSQKDEERRVAFEGRDFYMVGTPGSSVKQQVQTKLNGAEHAISRLNKAMAIARRIKEIGTLMPTATSDDKQRLDAELANLHPEIHSMVGDAANALSAAELPLEARRLSDLQDFITSDQLSKTGGIERMQQTQSFIRERAEVILRNETTEDPGGEYRPFQRGSAGEVEAN